MEVYDDTANRPQILMASSSSSFLSFSRSCTTYVPLRLANPNQSIAQTLPVEILTVIFGYCEEEDIVWDPSWYTVLHVCSRWYAAGVGCPALWKRVTSLVGEDGVREILRRSRDLPIDVEIPHIHSRNLNTALLMLREARRVKSLWICLRNSYRRPISRVLRRRPLQMIEDLIVDAGTKQERRTSSTLIQLCKFIPHTMVHLKQLCVKCNAHLSGMVGAPNLESLVLGPMYEYDERWKIDVADLLRALGGMPRLEKLMLAYLRPALFRNSVSSTRRLPKQVHLPALRFLCLDGEATGYALLCARLTVPATTRVALLFEVEDPDDVDDVVDAALQLFAAPGPDARQTRRELRSLALCERFSDTDLVIEGSSKTEDPLQPSLFVEDEEDMAGDFRLGVRCGRQWDAENDEELALLSRFLENIPLDELRSLNVMGETAQCVIMPWAWNAAVLDNMVDLSPEAGVCVRFASVLPPEFRRRWHEREVERWQRMLPKVRKVQWYPGSLDDYTTALHRAKYARFP